ncbi:MAG: DNA-3-methyladenine glycosylase family protein [bacterium]
MPRILSTNGPFDFALTLRRYQAFGEDAANWYDGRTFRKVFKAQEKSYILSLQRRDSAVVLDLWPKTRAQLVWQQAERTAGKILGWQFPLQDFYEFARNDAVLKKLTERYYGFRPTLAVDLFESLITSITAQQINLRFAFTVRSRLIRRYGEKLAMNGETFFAFPTPERLTRVRVPALRALQFTEKKSEYIIGLARAISTGRLDLNGLAHQQHEEIAAQLLPLHGIGRWTVDWLLARGLGRGDAIAAGDLGVRKAMQHFYFNGEQKSEQELRAFAQRWGEFTNLAVHYLLTGMALGS